MRGVIVAAAVLVAAFDSPTDLFLRAQQSSAPAQARNGLGTESGFGIFQQRCIGCHTDTAKKTPAPMALRQLTPEAIYQTLSTGVAHVPGEPLSGEEKRRVSESVSGRLLGTATDGDASQMPNRCSDRSRMAGRMAPGWNGWGADVANRRFQPGEAAGLAADDVPRLKLKWAFGFPRGVSAFGQPSIAERRAYFGLSGGGIGAIGLAAGDRAWFTTLGTGERRVSHAAAATAIPGAVFVGGSDGRLHGLSTVDGHNLWEFDTAREFATVNKVAARGGGIRAPGAVVAGGMVFVTSGYGVFGTDPPGNVVLAFAVE